eukprot:5544970-Alexandrium_andersonii.AAC.1
MMNTSLGSTPLRGRPGMYWVDCSEAFSAGFRQGCRWILECAVNFGNIWRLKQGNWVAGDETMNIL